MRVILFIATLANAFSPYSTFEIPIQGHYPGWQVGGNKAGIEIQVFEDLMDSDSAQQWLWWDQVLKMPFLGGTVEEQITMKVTPFVQTYHLFSFQVTQVVPYLMDVCTADPSNCLMNEYNLYCIY